MASAIELTSMRRNFLGALFALCAVPAKTVTQPSPILGASKPKFWFGDRVSFSWICDDDKLEYSENGNIVGAHWNPNSRTWSYSVIWTDSNRDENDSVEYPIFDGEQTVEADLRRL